MSKQRVISRREFSKTGASIGLAGLSALGAAAPPQQGAGAPAVTPPSIPRPDALKSELLLDLILETQPAINLGARTVVAVTGGSFEGPKLKGKVVSPGADWPLRVSDSMRVLDVRTVLVTDDDQRIYMSYRGVIYTPPAGQGDRYWRTTPIFETDSPKYSWLNHVVAIGVNYTVPQRVAYRIFQIL